MSQARELGLVLAVYPTSRGFGWALFEGPEALVDWSTANAKGKHADSTAMRRFGEIIDRYHPATLVMERYDGDGTRRGEHMRILAETMRRFAGNHDMDTPVYDRATLNAAVLGQPSATRHTVACAIGNRLPFLKSKLPSKRKLWDPEKDQMCLFNAVALGLTHYAITRKSI